MPGANVRKCAFSTDGVISCRDAYSVAVYSYLQRSGDTFTKLADPATLPAGASYSLDFSYDGTYLAVGHQTSPFITIYKRSGDVFTKLSNPATLPANVGYDVAFSYDGTYLADATGSGGGFVIYKRSDDTFTKLTTNAPNVQPGGNGSKGCMFSDDGTYLVVVSSETPFIYIYKRTNDTFIKGANPDVLPNSVLYTSPNDVAISADMTYVAVANSYGAPYLLIYTTAVKDVASLLATSIANGPPAATKFGFALETKAIGENC